MSEQQNFPGMRRDNGKKVWGRGEEGKEAESGRGWRGGEGRGRKETAEEGGGKGRGRREGEGKEGESEEGGGEGKEGESGGGWREGEGRRERGRGKDEHMLRVHTRHTKDHNLNKKIHSNKITLCKNGYIKYVHDTVVTRTSHKYLPGKLMTGLRAQTAR